MKTFKLEDRFKIRLVHLKVKRVWGVQDVMVKKMIAHWYKYDLFFSRNSELQGSITSIPDTKCTVTTLEISADSQDEFNFYVKQRR